MPDPNVYTNPATGNPWKKNRWGDVYYTEPGQRGHGENDFAQANPRSIVAEVLARNNYKTEGQWNRMVDNFITPGLDIYAKATENLFSGDRGYNPVDFAQNFLSGYMGLPVADSSMTGSFWMSPDEVRSTVNDWFSGNSPDGDLFNNMLRDPANEMASADNLVDLITFFGIQNMSANAAAYLEQEVQRKKRDWERHRGMAGAQATAGPNHFWDYVADSGLLEAWGLR
jgi:hypothetical protein